MPPVTPTKEQADIIALNVPVIKVEAVAGAGKTTLLALILKECFKKGIQPSNSIALCFSDGAKKRFHQKFREEGIPKSAVIQRVEEYALSQIQLLVKAGFLDQPIFYTLDEQIRPHLIDAANKVWMSKQGENKCDFDFSLEHPSRAEEIVHLLVKLKASLTTLKFHDEEFDYEMLEQIASEFDVPNEIIEICVEYEHQRCPVEGEYHWQNECDLVPDLLALLRLSPNALETMQPFSIYVIDEWHDVNHAEFELIRTIKRNARLVVVGDRFQIINSQRGANPDLSQHSFAEAFQVAINPALAVTQRFGQSLSKLSASATERKCISASGLETKLRRVLYDSTVPNDCASMAIEHVLDTLNTRVDTKLKDFAIIFREQDQSLEIENMLLDQNIRYSCEGFETYLLRPEILMLRALLHLASNNYTTLEGESANETRNKMVTGLALYVAAGADSDDWYLSDQNIRGEKENQTWLEKAQAYIAAAPSSLQDFFEGVLCRELENDTQQVKRWKQRFKQVVINIKLLNKNGKTAADLLEYIAKELDIVSATSRTFISRNKAESAYRSIAAFIFFSKRMPNMSPAEFLEELATRQKKIGKVLNYQRQNEPQLTLATIHAAKGQEWEHVLLPYIERNQFPRTSNTEEETRFFYVAITRAKKTLTFFEPNETQLFQRSIFTRLLNAILVKSLQ